MSGSTLIPPRSYGVHTLCETIMGSLFPVGMSQPMAYLAHSSSKLLNGKSDSGGNMARVDKRIGAGNSEVPRGKLLRVIVGKSPFVYQNQLYRWFEIIHQKQSRKVRSYSLPLLFLASSVPSICSISLSPDSNTIYTIDPAYSGTLFRFSFFCSFLKPSHNPPRTGRQAKWEASPQKQPPPLSPKPHGSKLLWSNQPLSHAQRAAASFSNSKTSSQVVPSNPALWATRSSRT